MMINFLKGIKQIKFQAWEEIMSKFMNKLR